MGRLETTLETLEKITQETVKSLGELQIEQRIRELAEQEIRINELAAQRYIHKLYGRGMQEENEDDEGIYERGNADPTNQEYQRSCLKRMRYHWKSLEEVPKKIQREGSKWKPTLAYDPTTAQQTMAAI